MNTTPKAIRRVLGTLFLGAAVVMLILGVTVLESRLTGRGFVWYWLACFICLWMSLMAAWLDIRAIRQDARAAQSELIKKVLSEKEKRSSDDSDSARSGGQHD